ncbi:MAG TPA: DUF998 domain-containing protein [Gemmataceae bacterium]|nr:DUF998 domain-containing protein [Gemmataceae bacterium]
MRTALALGVVVPILDGVAYGLVAARQPHYSFLDDYLSDLAAEGRTGAEVLAVLSLAFPALFVPFAVAVRAGLRRHRFGAVPAILLGLFAVFVGLLGIFRHDPAGPYNAFSRAHVVVSALANAALFPVPFFLWLATRTEASWRRLRRFSLVVQGAGAVTALLLALAFFRVIGWGGLIEWSYYGLYYVWVVALAIRLWRAGTTPARLRPPRRGRR